MRYHYGNLHNGFYCLPIETDREFYTKCVESGLCTSTVITCAIKQFMRVANEMGISYSELVNWAETK